MVDVDGHQMHVLTIGLENAQSGSPVVVFEAGFMRDGISAWRRIVQDVAEFAPIVAYDRAGIGESEPDGDRPTPEHVAENLHSLLGELGAEPPYVLVGHSLGGPFIRMFTALYADEVVGLVQVDPSLTLSEQAEREMLKAAGFPDSEEYWQRLWDSARAMLGEMPTPGMRAEAEVLLELSETHWSNFQTLPPVPDIPVSILMAVRFQPQRRASRSGIQPTCEPKVCYTRRKKATMLWLSDLVAEVTNGTLTVVTNSGHFIQNDDPDLVVWNIRRVVDTSPPQRRP